MEFRRQQEEKYTFYVRTGNIREVVVAPDPRKAVRGALVRGAEKELDPGLLTICSTAGFRPDPDKDLLFITENELRALKFNVEGFLASFAMSEEMLRAYMKLKMGIETFQGFSDEGDFDAKR